MAPVRLRLSADPSRLDTFGSEIGLGRAQSRLRQSLDDVVLTHVERLAPGVIGVVLLVERTVRPDEVDDIAADLRSALGIGPGRNELISDESQRVRGIGGESAVCGACGLGGGRHVPGCPRAVR
jgi:hypothetical protein